MKKIPTQKGFTILELAVSVGIFALMTALLVAKYGNFNNGILLTNLAYDVALTIRNAQSYGLNVKSISRDSNDFNTPFGVHFKKNGTSMIFFADDVENGVYDVGLDTIISTTNIKNGSSIGNLCTGTGPGPRACKTLANEPLDITFKRPDPNAIIKSKKSRTRFGSPEITIDPYAEIEVRSKDDSTRKVIVRSTGQIAVE